MNSYLRRSPKFTRASKTIVFGLITLDGERFFQRYGSFTGKEFVEFLKAACERFGKILMITDGAPQHRSKFVREEIGRLDGVELQFLPPGCPDLNAIEEVWRQMKHAVLDVPYVRFSSMCSDIDKWLKSSLSKLDIEKYIYRKGKCSRHLGMFCHLPAVDPVASQGNDPKRSDAPAISDYVVTSKLNGQVFVTCRSKY